MDLLLIAGGLALLFVGGETLARNAVAAAARLRVPPFVIGASVVAFGTSAPELVVAVVSSLGGHPGFVIGNVVGSNIANVLLALGLAALAWPLAVPASRALRGDSVAALGVSLAFAAGALWLPVVGRPLGAVLVLLLALLTWRMVRRSRNAAEGVPAPGDARPLAWTVPLILVGLVVVSAGAHFLVEGASSFARVLGVGEAVIGLSVVAIGTSLPEVATSVAAARRGEGGLAFGGIVGSNLFNLLGITGVAALASPVPLRGVVGTADLVLLVATAAALVALFLARIPLGRAAGGVLLLLQGCYLVALYAGAG